MKTQFEIRAKKDIPLKILCCYALFVIVTGALDSGNQKSSLLPSSASMFIKPTNTADSVTGAGVNTVPAHSFGGNAGN
ncbi:hypothetical protein [Ferruginibacter sp. SUN106]|uniref:hypothetical protein n=1 Tax=Ferruginibacter sp. SUN106 TaxID=2978348 RepID=UPI003D360D0F